MSNKKIIKDYAEWAATHTPTWETDNLVGNMLRYPKGFVGLSNVDDEFPKKEEIKKTKEMIKFVEKGYDLKHHGDYHPDCAECQAYILKGLLEKHLDLLKWSNKQDEKIK